MLSVLAEDIRDGSQGSFFLVYAIVTMSIGLPLSYLLSVIGQISSMGCVQAWKMVPITKGIGIGLALMMLGIAVVKAVTVAYAIYYLILAFHRVIDNYCEILMALIGLLINHGTFSLGVRDGESGRNIVFYVRLRTSLGDKIPFSSTIFRQIDTDVKAITCT